MILDRPVWNSLTTRHAQHAIGGERARRFSPDIGPLAGLRDDDPASLAALAELGPVIVIQAEPIAQSVPGVQMVCERLAEVAPDPRIVRLTSDDAPAMLALATLTKPGPFAARTHLLGDFYGIRADGVLVAMAGERMKHPGYTEVSGVCTHPDARGRGLARTLSAHVARAILARGEAPYLHAYASNTAAIDLYAKLGFRLRRDMHVATFR